MNFKFLSKIQFFADPLRSGLFLVLAWVLLTGIMSFVGRDFQKDSESLVLGKIIADKKGDTIPWGGNLIFVSKPPYEYSRILEAYDLIDMEDPKAEYSGPSLSNLGRQGIFWSFMHNKLGLSLQSMNILCAGLTAFTLVLLSTLFSQVFSPLFGAVFLGTAFLSPWLVWFGGNLYWVPSTWFLPAVFANLMYLAVGRGRQIFFGVCVLIAFLLKDCAGFEYVSTVILFASAPFFVDFFRKKEWRDRWKGAMKGFLICFLGVTAFAMALLIMAPMRAPTIREGLEVIYKSDFQRRGHGDPKNATGWMAESLAAKTTDVVRFYIDKWHTGVFWGVLSTKTFPILLIIGALSLILLFLLNSSIRWMSLGLFLIFMAAPLSWFILGKAHSFIHRHMNYVLWYFGAIQTLVFCILEVSPLVWRKGRSLFCLSSKRVS